MKQFRKVCFTGGPCAGKSSAIAWLRERYPDQFLLVPEVASFCIPIGLKRTIPDQSLMLHKIILATQLLLQQQVEISAAHFGKSVLLDRGALDCLAYVPNSIDLASTKDVAAMLKWYDVVIHMRTLAKNMPGKYSISAENHRDEDPDNARNIDDNLAAIWSAHPSYRLVESCATFDERMLIVISILANLGIVPAHHGSKL